MKTVLTDKVLRSLVEAAFPSGDSFEFRTFKIPPNAKAYDVGYGAVPLRCWPNDVRCGIVVYSAGEPLRVWVIEVDQTKPIAKVKQSLNEAFTMAVENMLADLAGTPEPHGKQYPNGPHL
jgi:hypothetical protein